MYGNFFRNFYHIDCKIFASKVKKVNILLLVWLDFLAMNLLNWIFCTIDFDFLCFHVEYLSGKKFKKKTFNFYSLKNY